MNNNISSENLYIDLTSPVSKNISKYDSEYPNILLFNGLKTRLAEAQTVVEDVYKFVAKEAPIIAQVVQSFEKGSRYVVDIAESTIKKIESGRIKLSMDKLGNNFAQIRESNGNYGKKFNIKKENFRKGMDTTQIANSLLMKAMEEQLQKISEELIVIDQCVREILSGQQNDRIGQYYSGLSLYLEASSITNNEMKNALIAQSLRALSEATFQLILTMKSDIDYLVDKKYKFDKGKSVNLIDEHMNKINQSFAFIHQATMLRAAIYCNQGELAAMSAVLDEYSYFIENTIVSNAELLSQCDTTDNGTEEGVWKSRARLKLDISEFANQLNMSDKTIYLGISKENE